MELRHVSFRAASAFVVEHHRHHEPPQGHIVSVGCYDGEALIGVAMIGHPVGKFLDYRLEVRRLCVLEGKRNASSWLLTRAKRLIQAMGAIPITYTLESEGGASLRAAGWRVETKVRGRSWSRRKRPRVDSHPLEDKLRWRA